jgi:tRNA modification GTPase
LFGDTITAISTAMGEAGIGIIRVSGDDALDIVSKIFRPKDQERFSSGIGFRIYLGQIFDPGANSLVDEVLVTVMRGPKSFTGEDVIEINCHGGLVAEQSILKLLLKSGARLAEPGEFTKRAFVNGRMDLSQAEAVIDLIRAKTSLSASSALEQLRGRLSEQVKDTRLILLEVIAQIEAAVDFPEEDLEVENTENLRYKLSQVIGLGEKLLNGVQRGKIIRDGLNTAIIGRPNVGKSSLLNALLREDRAIVTDIPGTTRDVLEEYINIKGIPLKLIDTAGIRETQDLVEQLGVDRALIVLEKADLVLFIIEAGRSINEEERLLLSKIPSERLIVVANKIDLSTSIPVEVAAPIFYVSALAKVGIEELEEAIVKKVTGDKLTDTPVISNVRHIVALENAISKVKEALESLECGVPPDLISIDIRHAWELLGEISGDTVGEDILDEIFSRFCIGK